MAKFAVILPAAGSSTRFRGSNERKKVFLELKGRAVWLRAVELFVNRDDVNQTIVAISPEDMEWFKDKFRPNMAFMDVEIVAGGAERSASVFNALQRVRDDVDFVVVHDAARPLLVKEWIDRIFQAAQESGAAIAGLRVSSTLKRVDSNCLIEETVSREGLWQAQTPQVFRREILVEAFEKYGDSHPTDEAQLVERLGHKVTVVEGWPMNIKITTADDFKMAQSLVGALPKAQSLGSLHPFANEEPRLL